MQNATLQVARKISSEGRIMRTLKNYINLLCDDYAYKPAHTDDSYSIDVSEIPVRHLETLISVCLENDTTLREMILDTLQQMFDNQMPEYEAEDRDLRGQYLKTDFDTGEKTWKSRRI